MSEQLGVVHYGLGPIGIEVARLVAQRGDLRSASALDLDPKLLGRALSTVIGAGPATVFVTDDTEAALGAGGAQVVAHCTGSSLERIAPQLLACIGSGLSVVSTCEELSYPWDRAPELARQLDSAAKRKGVAIIGTGVNPGFAMDYLPVVLSGASRRVDSVAVHRVQDAGSRRLPLQRKVGAGLSVEAFQTKVGEGTVRHVGLPESAQAVAAAFGWQLSALRDHIEPVVAKAKTPSGLGDIDPGMVTGVRQVVTGFVDSREVVRLELEMAVGLPDPRDEVQLRGDPDVRLVIPGGLHGDIATVAVVVNALQRIAMAPPGLRVMADLPPPHP